MRPAASGASVSTSLNQITNLILLVLGAVGRVLAGVPVDEQPNTGLSRFPADSTERGPCWQAPTPSTRRVHAATLLVSVGGLAWATATTRRLVYATLLGLALAALVLTKVIFTYLWIPIALALAATDLLRRRINWTTGGTNRNDGSCSRYSKVGAWMTRNYLVAENFSIVESRTYRVLTLRTHYNTMRNDEWAAGFAYYLPPTGESPWLESFPRESFERFEQRRTTGFRANALRSIGRQENNEMATQSIDSLLADPLRHLKVGLLLAWRGTFVEGGVGVLWQSDGCSLG